ncbi:MAG TPA: hypothetical protein P5250_08430, partial [Bacteroidales bacterium]|nr:hypothetical protein [Bacteroidales bacterium]
MKHLLLIICFLIINTFKLLAQNEIVITGKIYNYKNKPIAIAYYKDYLDYERKITGKTITKKDGSFSMKFKWDYAWPAFLILENETMELFLTPGDSLIIIAKYKKLVKTAKLSGTASYANNYLREHILQFSTMRKQMNKKQKKMKPNEMLLLHDTMYNREMKFFNTLQQNKAPEFYYYIYANIEYYYANRLFTYNLSRAEIEQRMLKIKYNNEDALTSMYYITFLDSY